MFKASVPKKPENQVSHSELLRRIPRQPGDPSPAVSPGNDKKELNIHDLGSGPGTASFAAAHFFENNFGKLNVSITALEQSAAISKDAKSLFRELKYKSHFQTVEGFASERGLPKSFRNKKYDLIIAANVFNEFREVENQSSLVETLIQNHLNENGVLIIIDPATQKVTRNLMKVRDVILGKTSGTVPLKAQGQSPCAILAPCLHQAACPMLTHNKRDWCHFYIEWTCPKIISTLDLLIGNKHDYLKMSYLILQKTKDDRPKTIDQNVHDACHTLPTGRQVTHDGLARVVSSPIKTKGKTDLLVCSQCGKLERLTQLDRNLNKKEAAFSACKRGDVLELQSLEKPNVVHTWNQK